MNTVVIYQSKTGFTAKYAKWIGEELNCPVFSLKEADRNGLSEYDTIIYGGGLMAGKVSGLDKFKKSSLAEGKKLVVFATGATPMEATEAITRVKNSNLSTEEQRKIPFFYLVSGLCYEKMGFFSKSMLKMMYNVLQKKKDRTEEENGMMQVFEKSSDHSDKKNLKELLACMKG